MAAPGPLKIHYFTGPGTAEPPRLALTIAGIPFEDIRYTQQTFPEFKAKTPFGQVPVLEIGDEMLAQSGAIERYCAKLAGLVPEDPLVAAKADQAVFLFKEILDAVVPTMRIADQEAKLKAREEIVATVFPLRLGQLQSLLDRSGGEHFAGNKLSWADINIFVGLSMLGSGMLDGIPKDYIEAYPTLKAFRSKIAAVPAIKGFYEVNNDPLRLAFRPDA